MSRSLQLILILLFTASAVSAVPLAEYQKSLKGAITALDTLARDDENETASAYEYRLTRTTAAIRSALPEKLSVEDVGSVYEVDNSWLYSGLGELEVANDSQQADIRNRLIERLRSVDERVTELEKSKIASTDSKAEANRKLAEILARSEYAKKNKQGQVLFRYIERFVIWLSQFLPRFSVRSGHSSPITLIAEIVIIALALGALIFAVVKLVQHWIGLKRGTKIKKTKKEPRIVLGERLEPEASATDLLAEAESLARNGNIRAAIRKTYIALLVELGERKVISLAQHKTNRDYLRSVSTHQSLYRNMLGLTNSFERHWYGLAKSSDSDWQDFRTGYLATLRTND